MNYKIVSGSTLGLSDAERFIESLDAIVQSLPETWTKIFDTDREVLITRAPGRLDLMGGIADYSGALVLQYPIARAALVGLQPNPDRTIRIASLSADQNQTLRLYQTSLEELFCETSVDYDEAARRFSRHPRDRWAAYVTGSFLVLAKERAFEFHQGADILIRASVPEGKGVSSSAALEVAVMKAIAESYEIPLSGYDLALLCQRVENVIVGAPCGVMDQMTASLGEKDRLLELLCQPANVNGTLALPDELEVWGIDSGLRHSVTGSDYTIARTAAFMGYRVIAQLAGLKVRKTGPGKVQIEDPKWDGYLARITTKEFEAEYAARLPQRIRGSVFLDAYQGINDRVTTVQAEVEYPLFAATQHPIYEHERVQRFAHVLKNWQGIDQALTLGELMYESHESYSRCGLGSDGTDMLVRMVREQGANDLFGAKITGGGSGGTVAVLGRRGATDRIEKIANDYQTASGFTPAIISGSSPGADAFGAMRVKAQ